MAEVFDLAAYLQRFPDVCRVKYGRTYSLRALEKKLEPVGSGKRWLVAKDVATLFDRSASPYALYWQPPDLKQLDTELRETRLYLYPDSGDLMQRVLRVFHNIGVASIVLRFVHPGRYGIFSTPVIHLLQVHRPHTLELYQSYCEELREWQRHFRLESVAQTETALWTYQSLAAVSEEEYARAQRAFENDFWVQRRRAAQVIRPFLKRYGPLELARILSGEDPKLAGKIAAEEYERLLRCASVRFFHRPLALKKGASETLISQLALAGFVAPEHAPELRRIWEIRNKAVHPGAPPTPEEVEVMIDQIQAICGEWEEGKGK